MDYATRRVELWVGDYYIIYKDTLRADKAMDVARKVWNDSFLNGPHYDRVVVRNERTGFICDEISVSQTPSRSTTLVRIKEKPFPIICAYCGWLGSSSERLFAQNPFTKKPQIIYGCPDCREVERFERVKGI